MVGQPPQPDSTTGRRGAPPGARKGARRTYGAARLALLVGSGVAAGGFWVGVVSAPLPGAAGPVEASNAGMGGSTADMAGMRHGPGGMDPAGTGAGQSMRHGARRMDHGGAAGARLRTRGS
jgi:hypothetical protein